ncbi:MAG: NFACT family protein, partial [Oscillospiraceae bacterium]|nr:NFACT family protein [Oscillospiraceae bacterium]
MALDGMMLGCIANEIKSRALGAKIDKIQQPARDKIVLHLRGKNGAENINEKLLIAASADCPRVHFTQNPPENPASPPMLCMLLRKLLTGGRLVDVRQPGADRVLFFDFDCLSELGNPAAYTLAVEIMGRCSNAILLDKSGLIVDALSRVDLLMSSKRLVLPGLPYELPPPQDKIDIRRCDADSVGRAAERILSQTGRLDKAILSVVQGVSPIVCRELAYRCGQSVDIIIEDMTDGQKERLPFFLIELSRRALPTAINDLSGKPIDVSFFPIEQYGSGAAIREYDSFSA